MRLGLRRARQPNQIVSEASTSFQGLVDIWGGNLSHLGKTWVWKVDTDEVHLDQRSNSQGTAGVGRNGLRGRGQVLLLETGQSLAKKPPGISPVHPLPGLVPMP